MPVVTAELSGVNRVLVFKEKPMDMDKQQPECNVVTTGSVADTLRLSTLVGEVINIDDERSENDVIQNRMPISIQNDGTIVLSPMVVKTVETATRDKNILTSTADILSPPPTFSDKAERSNGVFEPVQRGTYGGWPWTVPTTRGEPMTVVLPDAEEGFLAVEDRDITDVIRYGPLFAFVRARDIAERRGTPWNDRVQSTMRMMYNFICKIVPVAFRYSHPLPRGSLDQLPELPKIPERIWEDSDDDEFVRDVRNI
jgi:hypothetical protein